MVGKLLRGFFQVGFELLQARMPGPPRTGVWPHKPSLLSLTHARNSYTRQAFRASQLDRVRMGFSEVVEALIKQGTLRTGWLVGRKEIFLLIGSGSKKGPFICGGKFPVWLCLCEIHGFVFCDLGVKILKAFSELVSQCAIS